MAMAADTPTTDVAQLAAETRELLAHANRLLLGATISVDDTSWRDGCRLPDWTRGHVATHLARNADALARLAYGAHTGTEQQMYPGDREAEIEAGATRDGLELQTDLDRSTEALDEEFDRVAKSAAWSRPVVLRGGARTEAWTLPAMRLSEVVLHHVDLDIGYQIDAIDTATAVQCLHVGARRMAAKPDYPPLHLITETAEIMIGERDGVRPTTGFPAVPGPRVWTVRRSTCRASADHGFDDHDQLLLIMKSQRGWSDARSQRSRTRSRRAGR
jgi:maleylpyruvate isomerase